MKRPALAQVLLCLLSACSGLPLEQPPPGAAEAPTPSTATKPASAASSPPAEALEERHRARAQVYAKEGNWADALVHWELLALLRPDSPVYREALAEARASITRQAAHLMQLAELARKQGNLDQAELWYLRVLNLDRENIAAAQALRDIEADRTKRAYSNRPPRVRM